MDAKPEHEGPARGKSISTKRLRGLKSLRFFERDLDWRTADILTGKHILSIDTETDGLDFRKDKLRLVQIGTAEGRVYIVRNPRWLDVSPNLYKVLGSNAIKVFHHAMFDLRFIKAWMLLELDSHIECTKTLMKMMYPEKSSSIHSMLKTSINIDVPRVEVDYSKWNEPELTEDQLIYSAIDVLYLPKALQAFYDKFFIPSLSVTGNKERTNYFTAVDVCRSKAYLEVEGYEDLFDYKQNPAEETLRHREWWTKQQVKLSGDRDE